MVGGLWTSADACRNLKIGVGQTILSAQICRFPPAWLSTWLSNDGPKRQAGTAQVGLVLAAANDWLAIENDRTHIAVYRAVENGFAKMRPDAKGISMAVDPIGRELVSGDYFSADRLDVVAMMPVEAVPTLYSRMSDVFAWLSIAALVGLVARAILGRRKAVIVPGPEPMEAPLPVAWNDI